MASFQSNITHCNLNPTFHLHFTDTTIIPAFYTICVAIHTVHNVHTVHTLVTLCWPCTCTDTLVTRVEGKECAIEGDEAVVGSNDAFEA